MPSGAAGARRRGAGPLAPLRAFNLRTAPPLLIYLVAGASGFAQIAETFWVRERLGLSAADLLALSAWLTVPWTLKMVFGHLVDTVPVLGSRRRAYVLGGALLHAAAYLALAAAAAGRTAGVPAEAAYVAASLAAVVGLVVQDSVADALTTEVVDRTGPDGAPRDLAEVGRMSSAASAGRRRGIPDAPTTTGRPTPDGLHRSSIRSPSVADARSPSPAGQEREREDDHQRDHGGAVLGDPFECLLQHGCPHGRGRSAPRATFYGNTASERRDRRLPAVGRPRRPRIPPESTGWCSLAPC